MRVIKTEASEDRRETMVFSSCPCFVVSEPLVDRARRSLAKTIEMMKQVLLREDKRSTSILSSAINRK